MDIALFSPSSLFGTEDDDEVEKGGEDAAEQQQHTYLERSHSFPGGMDLCIREFSFHQLNANLLWPGSFAFSEWLLQHHSVLQGQRVLELGSGTGALAIFLRKSFGLDITTSDFDDEVVEENIAHNCRANGLDVLPHVRHTWAEPFPTDHPDWDLVIASDILLYVKQYPNLIKTLCSLLKAYKPVKNEQVTRTIRVAGKEVLLQSPMFLMSWRRRIGREDEDLFFGGCKDAGLVVEHLSSRVYLIIPKKDDQNQAEQVAQTVN